MSLELLSKVGGAFKLDSLRRQREEARRQREIIAGVMRQVSAGEVEVPGGYHDYEDYGRTVRFKKYQDGFEQSTVLAVQDGQPVFKSEGIFPLPKHKW